MRDELAGRLLDNLISGSDEDRSRWNQTLRHLAAYKYDRYERFSPGERFFERLARWLSQFDDPEDVRRLVEFVTERLIFISQEELNHAIACAYPDYIRPTLLRDVAAEVALPAYAVARIAKTDAYRAARRQTLYLGLSDGARLDRLRRSSPELSHEQFWPSTELGAQARATRREKLAKALTEQGLTGDPLFQRIVLVDDFYGSGQSLIREEGGNWKGKLWRAEGHVNKLSENGPAQGDTQIVAADPHVTVLLYVASKQAIDHVKEHLESFAPAWDLHVVQHLPSEVRVEDSELARMCRWFFDPIMADDHKGEAAMGYGGAALPVVLAHNTPNNSISLLWADTEGVPAGQDRSALFPRYERHHADRP